MKTAVGVNVNPFAVNGAPLSKSDLRGKVDFVRFVYQIDSQRLSVPQAISYYQDQVDKYNAVGIVPIIIINQETGWFNGPWLHGGWNDYISSMKSRLKEIIAAHQHQLIVWQIWNEGDILGVSSIYLSPTIYYKLVSEIVPVIRSLCNHKILSGGMASSASSVFAYVKSMEQLNGNRKLTFFDALSLHPYGQYVKTKPNISTGWFGDFTNYMATVKTLGYPMWLTEVGVAEDSGFPDSQKPAIEQYMKDMYSASQLHGVEAFIWWSYSSALRGGYMPNSIGDLKALSSPTPNRQPNQANLKDTANLRSERSTLGKILAVVKRGTLVTCLDCVTSLQCKLGNKEEWVWVDVNGSKGYLRGDMLV